MKILHLVNNLEFGGLEKLSIDLSIAFKRKNAESLICCLEKEGGLAIQASRQNIKVISLNKQDGIDLKLIFRLAAIIRQEKVDILHSHNMGPLVYGTLAARLAGIKTINTRHGREEKKVPRFIWALVHAVVAISEDAKTRLLRFNKVNAKKVSVIYNGVDIPSFRASYDPASAVNLRQKLGVKNNSAIIGIVARLSEEKDHETLLNAFKILLQKNIPAELIIVGGGHLESKLKDLAVKFQIDQQVKFLGFRNDISQLLAVFDVFVLSSLSEGISLTLLEAMSAGKPIIATRVGGNPEVVIDGMTGLKVPAKDPEQMAAAMLKLLSNRDLAKQMGEAGRKRVEEYFSLEIMVNAYEKIYRKILS